MGLADCGFCPCRGQLTVTEFCAGAKGKPGVEARKVKCAAADWKGAWQGVQQVHFRDPHSRVVL